MITDTKKGTKKPDILPCPWCGKKPELTHHRARKGVFQVWCATANCPISPMTYWLIKQDAIEQWNKRS
jgi:hypothetical protein